MTASVAGLATGEFQDGAVLAQVGDVDLDATTVLAGAGR
jgi:hypothetical protein